LEITQTKCPFLTWYYYIINGTVKFLFV